MILRKIIAKLMANNNDRKLMNDNNGVLYGVAAMMA